VQTKNKEYNFSLFKPVSEYGRENKNLIIMIVIIWALAVFGFQILLMVLEKPTPEKTLVNFESVWDNVKTGNATLEEKQVFIKSLIMVEGKSVLKKENKIVLDNAITWIVFDMIDSTSKNLLSGYVKNLKSAREKLGKANDLEYTQLQSSLVKTKEAINLAVGSKIGISSTEISASIIPYCLNIENKMLTSEDIEELPKIMKLYLTHNQSFLTDMKFLGFPFHYFYTAEFLLILFVLLCLFYSIRIEQLNKKHSIVE